jgi:TRAP-type C4-dicarboxylate transport system permease small subunit
MYFKIIFFITFLFFLYVGYYGVKEYISFKKSNSSNSLSIFEKIIINSLFVFFIIIVLFFLFNYIYLTFFSNL